MSLRLAVFDMVGTTVQAGDEVPASFREAFRMLGITLSDDAISRIRGRSKRDAIAELLAVDGRVEEAERVYARFREALQEAYGERARAVAGAEDTFRYLQGIGVPTVLITGLDRKTTDLLVEGLGWGSLGLRGVITGDDVARGRPAPDLIEAAMRLAGVADPRCVLAVGDTASDLKAASAARVGWAVGVLSGAHDREGLEPHPHSVLLESVADLPVWIQEVAALGPGDAADERIAPT